MQSAVPAIVLPPASANRMSPEEFFRSLHAAHAAATRVPAIHADCAMAAARKGRPPSAARRSRARLFSAAPPPPAVRKAAAPHFDVRRADGKLLRLTHAGLICFFDLTVEQACEAMLTKHATIKRLRCWYGSNSWPRCQLERGTHPTFTLDAIRVHRNRVMQWAFDSGEEVLYDSLSRALRAMAEADPNPALSQAALDALDAMFGEEGDGAAADPVTDFPFSLPEVLMPEAQEPEAQEQPQEEEPALPPGLYPWSGPAEEEPDEDAEFFESLVARDREPF